MSIEGTDRPMIRSVLQICNSNHSIKKNERKKKKAMEQENDKDTKKAVETRFLFSRSHFSSTAAGHPLKNFLMGPPSYILEIEFVQESYNLEIGQEKIT